MKNSKEFIELKNVSKTYNGANNKFIALNKVNLKIEKGAFVIIQGASGSGKSTLLNLMSGIDNPTEGEIWINDVPIHNITNNKLANWRGVNLGIVFQFFQLMPTLTVLENTILPMEFVKKFTKSEHRNKALKLLKNINMDQLADKFPHTLSGGEKQRVAIARALANDPSIIVADEPTGNLDSKNTSIIHELFEKLNKEGKTILYVTHEQKLPKGFTHKVILEDGKLKTVANIIKEEVLI